MKNVSKLKTYGLVLCLLMFGTSISWGQTILFDVDFTTGTWPASINEASGTASETTVNGVIFRTKSNKPFTFDATGMTWCNNNINADYCIKIPLTCVNGSITITAWDGTTATRISYFAFNTTAGTVSTASANPTVSAAIATALTDGYIAIGRQGSGITHITRIQITTPTGGPACGCTATGAFASASVDIVQGDAFPGNVFTTTNTSPQVWTSSNTAIATVNASTGAISLAGPTGSTTIRVTQITDATNCAVDKQYTLNVNPLGGCTAFSGTNGTVTKTVGDADFTLSPTVNNTSTPTYSSSNTAVATIVAGKVHAVAAGTSVITMSYAADGTYCAGTIDYALTVNASGGGGTDYTYSCENFDNGSAVVGTSFAGATGTWTINAGAIETGYYGTSPNSIKLSSSRQVTSPNLPNGAGTVSLWVRADGGSRTVTVATSTDGTTFTTACTSTSIANGTSTTYSCPVNNPAVRYVRITLNGTSEVDDICITPGVVPPTLAASPITITGLQKNLFNATNTTSQFLLTGANLTANATINAPAGFEISLNNSTWSTTTLTATQTAGIINQTVYVRIASSTIGNVSGDVTITSADVAGITPVNVSGKVVNLAPLATPAKPSVSAATASGFTGTWTAVPNATAYTLAVYDGSTLVKTITGVSGTTTNITGLQAGTTYTYTVMAEGNASYANSNPSPNSNTIVTLAPPASSPCAVTLYATDFSDWSDVVTSGTSSNAVPVNTEAGAGFILTQDMSVNSSTQILANEGGSEREVTFAPFNFVSGGSVIVRGKNTTTSSMGGISSVTPTSIVDASSGTAVTMSNVRSSDPNGGVYDLKFDLPASVNGSTALKYKFRGEIYEIIVCTNPGVNPQITTYPVGGSTVPFSAEIGGNTDAQFIELKGFNLTSGVTVSITGPGAGRFSVLSTAIAEAIAEGGTMLPVTYTSSVLTGTHDAVITFTSPGAAPVSINLHGTSRPAGGGCAITTSTADLIFATRIITPTTQTVTISGVNLTGNVTLAITGAGSAQFALSQSTVTAAQANTSGKDVTITYTGGIVVGNHSANLVITNGTCSSTVPLLGRTLSFLPTMYTLTTIAQPAEGGVLVTDIAGPQYPSGTVVKLTAVAETGYKFVRWSDITSYSATRNITMNSNKIITAIFAPSSTDGAKGDLEAYNITAVTATGFTANWKLVAGATLYTVNVFEQDINGLPGALVKTQTSAGTSVGITGLTTGKAYFYQVVANTPLGDTSEMLGSYPVGALQPITCGQE